MIALVHRILGWFRQLFGLVFPLFRQAKDFAGWGRWARIALHVLLLAGVIALLYWANNGNHAFARWLDTNLLTRAFNREYVRRFFLPAVFLLVYALIWTLYWIYVHIGPDAELDEYPDITGAWNEGMARLAAKGAKLTELPMFLFLGRNRAGEEFLFRAGDVKIEVFGPLSGEPPVRLWASADAIFVTAPGASALGAVADLLERGPEEQFLSSGAGGGDINKTVSVGDEDSGDDILKEIRELQQIPRVRPRTPEEDARLRELAMKADQRPARARVNLPADKLKESADRLRYLGKLMTRDRRPFCPVNGIVSLLPWEALETDDTARVTALALRTDLASCRGGQRLCCPALALVCDLESAPGFEEFCKGFKADELAGRIGQRFPLVPDAPPAALPDMYESGVTWLGERLFPGRVYQAMKLDPADARGLSARSLFHLYRSAWDRLPRLGRLLRTGLPADGPDGVDGPLLVAGCYLAGTGAKPDQQAFAAGIFSRLTENQAVVAWTHSALDEDRAFHRRAYAGYVALALFLAAVVALAFYLAMPGSKPTA